MGFWGSARGRACGGRRGAALHDLCLQLCLPRTCRAWRAAHACGLRACAHYTRANGLARSNSACWPPAMRRRHVGRAPLVAARPVCCVTCKNCRAVRRRLSCQLSAGFVRSAASRSAASGSAEGLRHHTLHCQSAVRVNAHVGRTPALCVWLAAPHANDLVHASRQADQGLPVSFLQGVLLLADM